MRVARSLLVCARRMARNSRWQITVLVVEVQSADGLPIEGARVRIDLHYAPLFPPHQFGPVSTRSNGQVTFRERLPEWGWVPVTIFVEPPTGTSLVEVVRPDSTHYGPLPALTHVVQVTLTAPEG